MKTLLIPLLITLPAPFPAAVAGQELLPFGLDTLEAIKAEYHGRPFLLTLWSADCPPCRVDLKMLAGKLRKDPSLPVIIVATDSARMEQEVRWILEESGLDGASTWIFAGGNPQALRYAIDPGWFGELPRSYFYSTDHEFSAHSGVIPEARLDAFLSGL